MFKDLKLLKLHDVSESEIIKVFCKFSRNELPKSICRQFNLVHEVRTPNILSVKKKAGEKWPNFVLGDQILTGLKF